MVPFDNLVDKHTSSFVGTHHGRMGIPIVLGYEEQHPCFRGCLLLVRDDGSTCHLISMMRDSRGVFPPSTHPWRLRLPRTLGSVLLGVGGGWRMGFDGDGFPRNVLQSRVHTLDLGESREPGEIPFIPRGPPRRILCEYFVNESRKALPQRPKRYGERRGVSLRSTGPGAGVTKGTSGRGEGPEMKHFILRF